MKAAAAIIAVAAGALSACFNPTFNDPTCGAGGACPSGWTCADGVTCQRVGAIGGEPDAPVVDPSADATVDSAMATGDAGCWSATNVDPCNAKLPAPMEVTLDGEYSYDTENGELLGPAGGATTPPSLLIMEPGGISLRVVHLKKLAITAGSELAVSGTMPLVVVVQGDVDIAGILDGGAYTGKDHGPGPGGNPASCPKAGAGGGHPGSSSGSAGGGGGHGAAGGTAQDDDADDDSGRGGSAFGNDNLSPLVGGCQGGGGTNRLGLVTALGGDGGGALQIAARGSITITGTITAAGAGGATSDDFLDQGGGGGGGAGGTIFLEGETIAIAAAARLCANGGGGGSGSIASGDRASEDGSCSASVGARGGVGGVLTKNTGGTGGFAAMPRGGNSTGKTAGGGGAVGRIRLRARGGTPNIPAGAIVSPVAVVR